VTDKSLLISRFLPQEIADCRKVVLMNKFAQKEKKKPG